MILLTPAAAAGSSIRFLEPISGQPVLGDIHIRVAVDTPAGVRPLKVELFVDERRIATLLDPPYQATWDFGEGTDAHVIRAKLYASDGSTATARARTVPLLGVQRANVLLVEVYVTVRTRGGQFVIDLEGNEFIVREDGVSQTLSLFSPERKPVSVVLLLDVSASMKREERLTKAIEAARIFSEALEPEDQVSLIIFSDSAAVVEPFTSDRERILASIDAVQAQRGTALYDAIHAGARMVGGREGRRALVLLSDGQDLAYDGMGPGSARTFEESVSEALRNQVTAYTIGLGAQLQSDYDFNRQHSAEEVLTRLATDTGGRFFAVRRPGRLKRAFQRILEELRFQYTLGYSPTNERRDGSWRAIEVEVNRPRLEVSARKGYFAPTD
jgi:Ca-activated chloride channel family protein